MSIQAQIHDAIARKGWSRTSEESGIDRVVLHRAFAKKGERGPALRTVERVLPALGLELILQERAK